MYDLKKLEVVVTKNMAPIVKEGVRTDIKPNGEVVVVLSDMLLFKLKDFRAKDYEEAIIKLGEFSDAGVITIREAICVISLIYIKEMETCEVKQYGTIKLLNKSQNFSLITPQAVVNTIRFCRKRLKSTV